MNKVIGFIGSGNMGGAMLGGIVRSKFTEKENIWVSDKNEAQLNKVEEMYGVHTTKDNCEVAKYADIIILAVKPNIYDIVMKEISSVVKDNAVVITIAAGITMKHTKDVFGKEIKVVRCMPNTPAFVNESMSAIVPDITLSDEEVKEIKEMFESFGKCEIVSESMMDAVTAVSGSSPAYVFMMIEAMADAAVLEGMPRNQAYTFAAQAVLGSAKMALESKKHPGELKDMVCSPAGTTIDAVQKLEEKGFRSAIIEAMQVCAEKSKKMTK